MTTEFSWSVDWQEEFREHPDKWINHGADLMEARAEKQLQECPHVKAWVSCGECGIYPDEVRSDHEPMMSCAYPLFLEPSDEDILRVCQETCCTVMENGETGDFFLALCGGGMDLSQDIALAYVLTDRRIPPAFAFQVATQHGLSKTGEQWVAVMKACEESLRIAQAKSETKAARIRQAQKEAGRLSL